MKTKQADGKPQIIMVDDDNDFQRVVQDWLAPRYDLLGLTSGEDLLEELDLVHPDLVIMDVGLPGQDGFKLCSRIRSDNRFTDIPVLFLTGATDNVAFLKNLEVGGSAFLTKPISRGTLMTRVRELIGT